LNLALLSDSETENGKEAIRRLLTSCIRSSKPGGYIGSQPDPERYYYGCVVDTYKSLGFEMDQYLDFEEDYSEVSFEKLLARPFIHLAGGNTFRFLNSLKARAAEKRLIEYAHDGGVIIGVSAGAMILTPSIESAVICGDENQVGLADLQGLGLVSFMFDPHSTKNRKNADDLKAPYDLLMASDDDAFIVIEDIEQRLGEPLVIKRSTT
jgi:dipeptidase E